MDKAYLSGLMVDNTMENGKTENNMERVNISVLTNVKEKDFGIMEGELNGLIQMKMTYKWLQKKKNDIQVLN